MKTLLVFMLAFLMQISYALETEATGYGSTQEEAILKGKREALAMTIGQLVQSKTTVENFMVQNDEVITKTMGYVKNYSILSSKKGPDGAFEVKLKVEVAQDDLKRGLKELCFLGDDLGRPRVAFLLKEVNNGSIDYEINKTTEMTLIKLFKERCFDVVEANHNLKFLESKDAEKVFAGDPEAAARIGASLNAEVIISGTAVASETDMSKHSAFANTAMKSATATINVKAINVSTRRIIATGSISESRIHPNIETAGNNAFRLAALNLIEKNNQDGPFFKDLLKTWQGEVNDGIVYYLKVLGVQSFTQSKAIQNQLSPLGKVTTRGFQKPELNLEIAYLGKLEALAEKLEAFSSKEDVKFNIEKAQGNQITLRIAK